MKSLSSLTDLKGKLVLVRSDLNSSVQKGRVIESPRIQAASKTISFLQKKGARVVVLAHQGSPGKKDCVSLRAHARFLRKYTTISFVSDVVGEQAAKRIASLKNCGAVLLENVRFLEDETTPRKKSSSLVTFFRKIGVNYYVNDAFSVCHRDQTSISVLPQYFPSFPGLLLEKELSSLDRLNKKSQNALFVLGGLKVEDIVSLIDRRILATGMLCLYGLTARGIPLGRMTTEIQKDKKNLLKVKKHLKTMTLPEDLAISHNGKRKDLPLSSFPQPTLIPDIGQKTADTYAKIILSLKKTDTVFYKGAPGNFEAREFSYGTKTILQALSKTKAYTIISGGSGSDALKKFGVSEKSFDHLSLSGGALVKYIAGENLPGLDALRG